MAVDATQLLDEELLARRDAWDLERPDLWRAVAACKGEEYRQAYAAFMERKADAEAVVAEIRTRGLVRPGRPRNDGAPPDSGRRQTDFEFSFSVEQSARHFVARGDGYVRLPEYDRTALASAIRAGVGRLRIAPGELLHATFRGEKATEATDVENIVLGNIGIPARALEGGIAFEHLPDSGDWPAEYVYEPVGASAALRHWQGERELLSWTDVPVPALTTAAIWWTLVHQREVSTREVHDGAVSVEIEVSARQPLSGEQIKHVFDGVVAAAQHGRDPDPVGCGLIARRLETVGIQVTAEAVRDAASESSTAVLGRCKRLALADGRLSPDDHRVVAGVLRTASGSETIKMSARLLAAALR